MHLLLIPESLTRIPEESLLYRKTLTFLQKEKFTNSIQVGVLRFQGGMTLLNTTRSKMQNLEVVTPHATRRNVKLLQAKSYTLKSKQSWVPEAQVARMARRYAEFLVQMSAVQYYESILVYARGCYLQAMRRASAMSTVPIQEVLSESDVIELRKKGMAWMKVGLRLTEAWRKLEDTLRERVGQKSSSPSTSIQSNPNYQTSKHSFTPSYSPLFLPSSPICSMCGTPLPITI